MGFYASFNKFSDMTGAFDGTIDSISDTDPFTDESDVDPTGLDTSIENMEDTDPFEPDDEATEDFENLTDEDVEVGESLNEEGNINEIDLDFDPSQLEPDWDPMDDTTPADEATGTSHEDESADTQLDDEPYDEWSEVSPNEEIDQWDDILEDDDISQLEETGYDEPIFYPDEGDDDQNLTNDAVEDIITVDHLNDITDDAFDEIESPGQGLLDAGDWVASFEDFLDFTEQDTTSFHEEVSTGYEITDGYDPPYFPDIAVDALELGNLVDDVFSDVFPDPVNDPFAWFDSFTDM